MTNVAYPEQIDATYPAYAFVDEHFVSADAFAAQRAFELGGDYGTDPSSTDYVGPIGALAVVMNAPGEATDYQRAFEAREISAFDFMAIMVRETAEARIASLKTAGAKVAGFFSRLRESFTPDEAPEHIVSEGVVALAAGSAATRRALML